jgi:hypothetical protein
MAQTVASLFRTPTEAQSAILALVAQGIPRDTISYIAPDSNAEPPPNAHAPNTSEERRSGTEVGAAIGAITGAALTLTASVLVPGLGAIFVAGPIIAGLVGAGVGAVGGSLIGLIDAAGISSEQVNTFTEGVRRGGALVLVRTEGDQAETVRNILDSSQAVTIDTYRPKTDTLRAIHDRNESAAPRADEHQPRWAEMERQEVAEGRASDAGLGATPNVRAETDTAPRV